MNTLKETVMAHESDGMAALSLERELRDLHDAGYGWALACCGRNPDAAQDALQSAYLRVLDGRARFSGRASIRTWFFAVIRTVAAERRRREWVRGAALKRWFGAQPPPEPSVTPETRSRKAREVELLHAGLERLSRRQREVLHLVFYQELTVEDAAAVLGITVGSARTHYARGKARLRDWLSGAGVEGS